MWAIVWYALFHVLFLWMIETTPSIADPLFGPRLAQLVRTVKDSASQKPKVILFLGSSRCHNGVNALRIEEALEAELGQTHLVFNLATAGSGPVTQLLYLRRCVEAGVKPDVVCAEIYPYMLHVGNPVEQHWLGAQRIRRSEIEFVAKYDFPRSEIESRHREQQFDPFGEFRWPVLSYLWPSVVPWELRLDSWRAVDRRGSLLLDPRFLNRSAEDRTRNVERTRQEHKDLYSLLLLGGAARKAQDDLVAYCQEQGIAVVVFIMPEASEFRALYHPGLESQIQQLQRELRENHQCPCIDARLWIADAEFHDGHHLEPKGANQFSDRLTQTLLEKGLLRKPRY